MLKIFLDANIYFAASCSPEGGSGFIVLLAKSKKLKICVSQEVILEAERNIRKKLSLEELLRFYEIFSKLEIKKTTIKKSEAQKYQDLINFKDSWILAAGIKSRSDFLITLDKKHFFTAQIQKAKLPIAILRPEDFLKQYVRQSK